MTVLTTTDRTIAQGNGVTTIFNYDFLIDEADHVVITYTDTAGVETVVGAGDYNLTGLGNPLGGTVEYPLVGSPIASGTTLTIQRVLPATQNTVFDNQGAFYPTTVEDALDYVTMLIQQYIGDYDRALRIPVSEESIDDLPAVAARRLQLLGFDTNGDPIATQPSTAAVSAAMQPVVAGATLASARALLGTELWGGTGAGTANAQTVTCSGFVLATGNKLRFKAGATNTGATTIAVNGGSAVAVRKLSLSGLTALTGYEIVNGNVYDILYDGTNFILLPLPQAGYVYGSVQVFTSSGTWTKPAGCRAVEVEVVGGGGGGGGSQGTSAGQVSAGGGGGGGGYARKFITTGLGATETVTVGAGGTAGVGNPPAAGGTGGTSSFGAHASATGGAGGNGSAAAGSGAQAPGGAGGIGSSGDLNVGGCAGGGGVGVGAANTAIGGMGGSSHLGGGGVTALNNPPGAGRPYGGGGGSAGLGASQSTRNGAAGAAGVVIVREYY